MTRFNRGINKLSRRTVLKGASTLPIIGAGIAGGSQTAAATEESTFVIEQAGKKIPVTPLSYEDQSIEEFYSYDSPNRVLANTPTGLEKSDTTRLFLYEGPKGISLVVIHDAPFDGGGGSVRFDFENLPSDGSWVVRDDTGEGFTRTTVDWGWVARRTDGGAYRGDFKSQSSPITITPSFQNGIDTWEVLSGDPRDPTVTELDLNQPITISGGQNLQSLIDEKIQLAGNIDQVSASLSEQSTVKSALDELEAAADSGAVSGSEATEAVERMLLGEGVTQATLEGLGPNSAGESIGFVDSELSIPDNIQSYQTCTRTMGSILSFLTSILISKTAYKKLRNSLPQRYADNFDGIIEDIDDWFKRMAEFVVGKFEGPINALRKRSEEAADLVEPIIAEGGKEVGEAAVEVVGEYFLTIDVLLGEILLDVFETKTSNNVESALEEKTDTLAKETDFSGDYEDARQEVQTIVDTVTDELEDTSEAFDLLENAVTGVEIFESAALVVGATGIGTIAAVGAEAVGTISNALFNATKLLVGFGQISEIVSAHDRGLNAVVLPEVR